MAEEMFMAPPLASIGITICAPVMRLENTRFETSVVETTSGDVPYVFSFASTVIVPEVTEAVISVFVNFMFCEVVFPETVKLFAKVIVFAVTTFVTTPPSVSTFAVTFAPSYTLTTSSNANGDAQG
jgi:hypothetical protein